MAAAKSQATKDKEKSAVHLTKIPEWMFGQISEINEREYRNSRREVILLLLAGALKQYEKHQSLTGYLKACGVNHIELV